jgi:PIN domain nuclease of toxin-antitoxin system
MRIILDTHVLLWTFDRVRHLSPSARDAIEDPMNDVFFSAASIWEVAIKTRLGRLDFAHGAAGLTREAVARGFRELPINADAAATVADLPMYHRDPFDRILIAQALCEPARLFTADATLSRYSDLVTIVS